MALWMQLPCARCLLTIVAMWLASALATDPPPPGGPELPTCGLSDVGCSNANGAKQTCACFGVAGVELFACDQQSSECSPWTIYMAGWENAASLVASFRLLLKKLTEFGSAAELRWRLSVASGFVSVAAKRMNTRCLATRRTAAGVGNRKARRTRSPNRRRTRRARRARLKSRTSRIRSSSLSPRVSARSADRVGVKQCAVLSDDWPIERQSRLRSWWRGQRSHDDLMRTLLWLTTKVPLSALWHRALAQLRLYSCTLDCGPLTADHSPICGSPIAVPP